MWQHLINFILGLTLVLIALIAVGMDALAIGFVWTLGIVGAAIAAFAVWGLLDEMGNQPRLDHGIESNF